MYCIEKERNKGIGIIYGLDKNSIIIMERNNKLQSDYYNFS